MLRKCFDACRVRGQQVVSMAVFATALISGAPDDARIVFAAQDSAIFVSNVEELYAVVNDAANAGAAVGLAPGVYTLSATDAAGAPRPNNGRLELKADMSVYGVAGDRAAVVIDASFLPASSFTVPFGRTGVIRAGLGSNAIEWLTIAGHPFAAAAVETDLVQTDPQSTPMRTTIRVAHVVAGGRMLADGTAPRVDVSGASARGVDIRNVGTAGMAGRRIDAEIVDSEVFGGVEGIRIINFNGAHFGEIAVVMQGNRSYANGLGCIIENNRSNSAKIFVRSSGDRFEDNGLGCEIGGALVAAAGVANTNTTIFEAHGTHFTNNTRTEFFNDTGPAFTDLGGLLVVGAEAALAGAANTVSGNTVVVRLWGSKIAENQEFDFQAFGARSAVNPPGLAGTDNHAVVELHGVSKFVEIMAVDSEPADPEGTNTVTVVRRR
jgi:hypothetical protein